MDILAAQNRLLDRDTACNDVLEREKTMSTGMNRGIALPHARTDGVDDLEVAVGIKKEGVDFESMDGEKSTLFILTLSPKKTMGPHLQFLAAIGAKLTNKDLCEEIMNSDSPEQAAALLSGVRPDSKNGNSEHNH